MTCIHEDDPIKGQDIAGRKPLTTSPSGVLRGKCSKKWKSYASIKLFIKYYRIQFNNVSVKTGKKSQD